MQAVVVCLLALLALGAQAVRAAPVSDESVIDTAQTGVVLPRAIGPLQFVGDRKFEDPRLGKAYSYRADGFSLDIYIYAGTSEGATDGASGSGARNEYEAAKETVLSTDAYATRTLVAEGQARLGEAPDAPEALEAAFDLVLRGQRLRSFLWVTAANGYYFKARFSMLSDLDIEAVTAREHVLQELGSIVTDARARKLASGGDQAQPSQYQIQFETNVGDVEMPFWILYLLARVSWEQQHGGSASEMGSPRVPAFDEEVFARGKAVSAFDETLDDEERGHVAQHFPYFAELKRVIDAGYLREYVWLELRHDAWVDPPADIRERDYYAWRAQHLSNHVPVTRGTLRLTTGAQ